MAQRTGRVSCPRCGANNFDTVTSCWKCGSALGSASAAAPAPTSMPLSSGSPMPMPSYPVERAAAPVYMPAPAASNGDPGAARRAAVALGLTLPFIGLPVGWVFMMIEDDRKQAIGRLCATWSMIGLVFQLLGMYVMAQQSVPLLLRMMGPAIDSAARRSVGGGSGGGNDMGLPGGQ